jgi:hypothetical protein
MILNDKGNKSIAIITAYRPCENSPGSAGDKTVYTQQFRTLLAHATSINSTITLDPHRQFTLDLQAWISKLQAEGHSILHSGVLHLYSVFHGDHNAVYLYLDSQILFAEDTCPIEHPRHCGLQLKDPRKVDACITFLHKQLQYHKVLEKLQDLDTIVTKGTWTDEDTTQYEKLDTIVTESMRHAEREVTRTVSSTLDQTE